MNEKVLHLKKKEWESISIFILIYYQTKKEYFNYTFN